MRANLNFIRGKYQEFNETCFNNSLPDILIQINSSRRSLGQFIHPSAYPDAFPRGTGECCIRISSCFDMEPRIIEDTLIHEMIHYLIWVERMQDSGPHGTIFRSIMNDINRRFGRNLTIRKELSAEEKDSERGRSNYIMVAEWDTGDLSMSVCAKTRIPDFLEYYSAHPRVRYIRWYWSASRWFNRFPVSRSLKTYKLSREDFETEFKTATECECTPRYFRPLKK